MLVNNIIAATGAQTAVNCGPTPSVFRFNDVHSPAGAAYAGGCTDQTGSNGNQSGDPLFVGAASGDYHLQPASPAIDAGDSQVPELSALDLDGDPRIIDGDGDGTAVVDLGVDEFVPPAEPAATPFAAFDARLTVTFGRRPQSVSFALDGSFQLGSATDGLNPAQDELRLELADAGGVFFEQTLPAGSLRPSGGRLVFRASPPRDGIRSVEIARRPRSTQRFTFAIEAVQRSLGDANQSPASVSLRIGNDAGARQLNCRTISSRRWQCE